MGQGLTGLLLPSRLKTLNRNNIRPDTSKQIVLTYQKSRVTGCFPQICRVSLRPDATNASLSSVSPEPSRPLRGLFHEQDAEGPERCQAEGIGPCSRPGAFHFGQGNTEEGSPTWGCWPLSNQRSLDLEDRATDTKVMHRQDWSPGGGGSPVGQKVSLLCPASYVPCARSSGSATQTAQPPLPQWIGQGTDIF